MGLRTAKRLSGGPGRRFQASPFPPTLERLSSKTPSESHKVSKLGEERVHRDAAPPPRGLRLKKETPYRMVPGIGGARQQQGARYMGGINAALEHVIER